MTQMICLHIHSLSKNGDNMKTKRTKIALWLILITLIPWFIGDYLWMIVDIDFETIRQQRAWYLYIVMFFRMLRMVLTFIPIVLVVGTRNLINSIKEKDSQGIWLSIIAIILWFGVWAIYAILEKLTQ